MKKLLLALVLVAFAIGCASKKPEPKPVYTDAREGYEKETQSLDAEEVEE